MTKDTPLFLFVCIENACRSQMAEGILNTLTTKAQALSAGTKPGSLNPKAIDVMNDRGIDISQHISKSLTPELVNKSFKVITMGCIDTCPFTPPEKRIEWNISDPKEKDKDFFIAVRNQIEKEIIDLLETYSLI